MLFFSYNTISGKCVHAYVLLISTECLLVFKILFDNLWFPLCRNYFYVTLGIKVISNTSKLTVGINGSVGGKVTLGDIGHHDTVKVLNVVVQVYIRKRNEFNSSSEPAKRAYGDLYFNMFRYLCKYTNRQ